MPPPILNEDIVNNDRAFQVAWLVYINGIEVPCITASVAYGVWQIPEAEITLIPDPIIARLGAEDRVSVQVFYCDYWMSPGSADFRLMFDGEIVGWSYVNVQRGRALSFNCVDYIQIWTQLFFFFMSSMDDVATGTSGQEIGVDANGIHGVGFAPIYPYSLFAQGIIPASTAEGGGTTTTDGGDASNGLITRPIDFVYNVIRGLIDSQMPNRSVPACNFFAPWTQRTNFHRRFVAIPYLETSDNPGIWPILRAVRADFAVSAVCQQAQRIGSSGSVWEMLQSIMQVLMMEIAMLPTAAAVMSDYASLEIKGPAGDRTDQARTIFLTNYFTKPQFMFGLPPVCNVFFPSQIVSYSYEENFITQPTRMYFSEESWLSYLNVDANASAGLASMIRDALSVAHPEEVNQAARAAVDRPGENGKNVLVYPEEFFKGPVVDRRPMPQWFTFLGQAGAPVGEESPEPAGDDVTSGDVLPGDSDRDVFRLYAKYEYFKERYSRRTGALQLVFNPYPVPGFPCATFDRRSTQIDTFGYIMSVRQTLQNTGWSTQASFTHGRTFQEMFALMNQQFAFENTLSAATGSATAETIAAGEQASTFPGQAQLVGAIATAPPEPIAEIRDVIQNFDRAEAFYRTMFFREQSPTANELTEDQISAESDRSQQRAEDNSQESIPNTLEVFHFPTTSNPTPATGSAALLGINKRASFHYPSIIRLVDPVTGTSEAVQLQGLDSTARNEALSVVERMRAGTATTGDLQIVASITSRTGARQQVEGQPLDPSITTELDALELTIRTAAVTSNVRGDRYVIPQDDAQELFDRYEAAMQYAARPICTLDEYVTFLGSQGLREGMVRPETAILQGDSRTFPAIFYIKIRDYIPGPPEVVPSVDITNSAGVTSTDGIVGTADTAAAPAPETGTDSTTPAVQGLPANFPQTRYDWSSLLIRYREAALAALAPRT